MFILINGNSVSNLLQAFYWVIMFQLGRAGIVRFSRFKQPGKQLYFRFLFPGNIYPGKEVVKFNFLSR